MTTYKRCEKCNRFFKDQHKCNKVAVMDLENVKFVLKEYSNVSHVMVASNGLFASDDKTFWLQIKEDFKLNHGVHELATIESNKPSMTMTTHHFELPAVTIYDYITEDLKKFVSLGLPAKPKSMMYDLICIIRSQSNFKNRKVTLAINDEFAMYNDAHIKMVIKGEWV